MNNNKDLKDSIKKTNDYNRHIDCISELIQQANLMVGLIGFKNKKDLDKMIKNLNKAKSLIDDCII